MEKDLAEHRMTRVPLKETPKKDWRYNPKESLRLWALTAYASLGIGFIVGICISELYGNGAFRHLLQTLFR